MATLAELAILLTAKDQASSTFQTVEKNAGGMGSAIGGIAKTVATVGAVAGVALGAMALKSVGAASDMAESQNKVNVVFGEGASAINEFAKTASRSVGLSRQAALDATGTFGNMFTQLGIGEKASADMSTQMVRLAADFGSFHNADISEVIAAQTSAFRGEFDAVQRFVPTINAAAVAQKALEMSGKSATSALTDQEKALAVQTLMMEGAGKATGDFANTSTGMANSMRIIQASIGDATAQIGEKLLPIVTPMIAAFAQWLPGAIDTTIGFFDKLGPVISTVAGFLGGIAATIGRVVSGFSEGGLSGGLSAMITELGSFGPKIGETLMGWGKAFLDWIGPMVPPLLAELGKLAGSLLNWVVAQIPVLLERFGQWVPIALDWIVQAANEMLPKLLLLIEGILAWVTENGPILAQRFLSDFVPAAIGWVVETAIKIIPELVKLLATMGVWILTKGVPALLGFALAMGKAIFTGFLEGIGNLAGALWTKVTESVEPLFKWLLDKIKRFIDWINRITAPLGFSIDTSGLAGADLPAGPHHEGEFSFHRGGIVPGPIGAPRRATVLGGETVLPVGASGGASIIVNVYGSVTTEDNLVDAIHRALLQRQDRNASLGFR